MKKSIITLCFHCFASLAVAQNFSPTWQSLDTRPVPQWYRDSKFGIFIHWGVYAVPGYTTKGNYAEWYQYGLQHNDTARIRYHKIKFGTRSYYDLAKDFNAELFNPDEWAKVFEQSGAKYIVLTSKHHDGFCLWPSQEANRTWGFPWNAVDAGPKRNLLGDLFAAVRKTSVHAGMYYSLYEWFNPLWLKDKSQYATTHMWPQMKDLISTYQPDVFWTDGDWDANDDVWKSKEFLAWLYNESPVKDKVVTFDRWGSGIRFKHGGVFTPEYQPDVDFEDHYWEESRGMGFSYGYNREEDAWDYNSAQTLVLNLIDKVSRGGNFLLDIGPDEHGKIPPIMQERLLQIGDWLKINGDAIYHTTRWKTPSQWSEGRTDYKPQTSSGDVLLKLTVDPDPGFAVKEIFYTYNSSSNNLYCIFPKYPSNHKLIIKNIQPSSQTTIRFLSTQEKLTWKQEGKNVVVELPDYDPNKIKAPYAYALAIENYGKFISRPKIQIAYGAGSLAPTVTITSAPGATTRYTVDGTEPGMNSPTYTKSFMPGNTCVVMAASFQNGALPSSIALAQAIKYQWLSAVNASKRAPGIAYQYYEPQGKINMESINTSAAIKSGITSSISTSLKLRNDKFALKFEGLLNIDKDGIYSFFTTSDDGSKLFVDGVEIVNNDGDHGDLEQSGKAGLRKGFHKISVLYFDSGGSNSLKVMIEAEGGQKTEIPASKLFH